ncbi:hypothetical protein [Flagellimonas meishanensis]|uniref:hypothetical protein n=1 Tax=Flagellimonas meishanensis TaxID=2873264 RepID=UPI001CA7A67A|nr:hypothetical protein [[Muricauda] meishanensis]
MTWHRYPKNDFFNYEHFYKGEPLLPFIDPCTLVAPRLTNVEGDCILRPILEGNVLRYVTDNNDSADENVDPQNSTGPYLLVDRICGDCTVLGTGQIGGFQGKTSCDKSGQRARVHFGQFPFMVQGKKY